MLPILTLSNLMEYNSTLFDNIALPTGASKQELVNTIMMQYGDMQPLAPDWSVLRYYIDNWFSSHRNTLSRLWDDYTASYNPIFNKDATFEETRTPNITKTASKNGSESETRKYDSSSSGNGSVNENSNGSITDQYKGFQSSAFNDVEKRIPTNSSSQSMTNAELNNGNAANDRKYNDSATERETGTETITRREYGNVGTTMSSQMLKDDKNFWVAFNWYDIAAKLWAVDNLVMIY